MMTALLNRIISVVRDIRRIKQLTFDPKLTRSYYPSEPAKTKVRIAIDLLWWYLRYRDLNEYYYVYGFDRRSVSMRDYLPYPRFRSLRNRRNRLRTSARGFDYICVLQDKFIFSQVASSLGIPVPQARAICKAGMVIWLDERQAYPLEELPNAGRQLDSFCKPLAGINGSGIFPLRTSHGRIYIGDDETTIDEFVRRMDTLYLIQDRVVQHPAMSTLHPQSLNTLRVVTVSTRTGVHVLSAAQRVGTNGRPIDNWTAGGILIGVDLATGRLRADGFYKPGHGGKIQLHPQTGVAFLDFEVPHFREAVEIVKEFHEFLYGIHSIGWDIAISSSGPVVIEGNDDWDGAVPMTLESNFRRRFLEMSPP